jgi:hypothetical protein
MVEFMKKAMEWVLEKEDDAAKNCHVAPEDVEKQIKMMEEKRDALKKKCDDDLAEMGHILNRLHKIKADSLQCHRPGNNSR